MIVRGGTEGYEAPRRLPRRLRKGRKTICGHSGARCYEGDLLTDEYNVPYWPRAASPDITGGKER